MTDSTPNAEQVRIWNEVSGPRWVAQQERLDAQLDPVGLVAMSHLPLSPGDRVLDVGCGCGSTSLELARRVTATGLVVGVDISAPLLSRATERAAASQLANTRFITADAQTATFADAPFDAVFSRFGVMFFDDPTAAFTNIRDALRPGGRMVFVCWRAAKESSWVSVPFDAVARHVDAPPPTDPHAPGPFALADRDRLHGILTRSGFTTVTLTSHDTPVLLGGGGDVDAAADFVMQIGPAAMLLRDQSPEVVADARASLHEALRPYATPEGVALGGSVWIVSASP